MSPNRQVLVAGALGGLASATIAQLLGDGYGIVAVDRRDDEVKEWLERVAGSTEERERICFRTADLTHEEQVSDLAASLADDGLNIDGVVNAAGIQVPRPVWDLETKYWELVLGVNLSSSYYLAKHFAKGMADRGFGRIVFFSSVYAYQPTEGQAAYAAAKAGVVGLMRALSVDLARYGVTANAVAPAVAWHPGLAGVLPEAHFDELASRIPQGRFGTPDEVAACVRFLVSEGASHVTGQTIHVNGGMFPGG